MPASALKIGAVAITPVHAGEWCAVCALPSGVTGTFATTINGEPWEVLTITRCAECGCEC